MAAKGIRAGRAFVELLLDDTKMTKGLRAAQAKLTNFGKSVTAIGAGLVGLGTTTMAPLLAALAQFSETGARIGTVAERIGTTTEAISELGFAAKASGVDVDIMQEGITEMSQRLGEAAETGTGSLADELKLLGLNAKELGRAKPEDAFGRISDAINDLPDASTQLFAADEIFGGEGREMINLIKQGSEGMAELRQQARDAGVSMNAIDSKSAREMGSAWNKVKATLSGVVMNIGASLAPLLTEVATKAAKVVSIVSKWVKENRPLITTIFKIAAAELPQVLWARG